MKSHINSHAGYTLLEILVALAVFAILSSITASALHHAFDTRTRLNKQANQLNEIQLALAVIARDTEQAIDRAVVGTDMQSVAPFIGQAAYVEFTRGGWVNPQEIEARSTLQRVAYVCAGNQLIRRTWERTDTPHRNQYQDKVLLNHIEHCKFGYLATNRQTLSEWRAYAVQQNQKKESLPIAIEFTLDIQQWGKMSLFFALPEALYAS